MALSSSTLIKPFCAASTVEQEAARRQGPGRVLTRMSSLMLVSSWDRRRYAENMAPPHMYPGLATEGRLLATNKVRVSCVQVVHHRHLSDTPRLVCPPPPPPTHMAQAASALHPPQVVCRVRGVWGGGGWWGEGLGILLASVGSRSHLHALWRLGEEGGRVAGDNSDNGATDTHHQHAPPATCPRAPLPTPQPLLSGDSPAIGLTTPSQQQRPP